MQNLELDGRNHAIDWLVIPLGLKIIYTLFVCALAPIYWRKYGPANLL
jgi:hypothetical protein